MRETAKLIRIINSPGPFIAVQTILSRSKSERWLAAVAAAVMKCTSFREKCLSPQPLRRA